jgi:hypothetical protein
MAGWKNLPDDDPMDDPDAWVWCPEHEAYFPMGEACPDCLKDEGAGSESDWGPDDVVGLGPGPADDGWYRDLVNRAEHPGTDPHSGFRE